MASALLKSAHWQHSRISDSGEIMIQGDTRVFREVNAFSAMKKLSITRQRFGECVLCGY
ncbi:MAG: hypothetical protein U5R06_17660 [candidate division KSB1 bacterium]|nr:hypothetical protein [candidate division KSB1 bacterium]